LRACWRLVRPGGHLWIGTPNIATPVARQFGTHWQMLEAPRHLTFFSSISLTRAFSQAGIGVPDYQSRGWCVAWVMQDSSNIGRGALANTAERVSADIKLRGMWHEVTAWLRPHLGVEITAIARKSV
jgi:hypothetical protein